MLKNLKKNEALFVQSLNKFLQQKQIVYWTKKSVTIHIDLI
jgi:hypothetical protein